MKKNISISNIFKSCLKGTFLGATLTTTLGAFLATALYINDNYSNPLAILSKYYLSIKGLVFGILVPVFVGFTTAGLVMVLKKISSRFASNSSLKAIIAFLLLIAYISITFLGAIIILYLVS